jgi:hypothetical protein
MRYVIVITVLLALGSPGIARAEPPTNDNRAAAEQIPAFPATLQGTTVGATAERLDPQTGQCGASESTVWYRIDQAPDGLIRLAVKGAGLAPAVRVFRVGRSAISEVRCANARAGAAATMSIESVRGAAFLVMVGKRPGTADAAFQLDAALFLPPGNDHRGGALHVKPFPTTVSGSTVGATSDDTDPSSCELAGQTVWYAFTASRSGRIAVKLRAGSDLDTSLVVLQQVRSKSQVAGCAQTGRNGQGTTTLDLERGGRYLIAVGQQRGSPPGPFSFQVVGAQARETVATRVLGAHGVRESVHGLADVNDLYVVRFRAGVTYRIAFRSGEPCPSLSLFRRGGARAQGFSSIDCAGYRTFTPGPDGGGRYVLAVDAAPDATSQPYRLQVAAAGQDDIGVGSELANHTTRRGSLDPGGVDIVDLYHFDILRLSDVRVTLAGAPFGLLLLTDTGSRIATGANVVRRLGPGRYVVAVQAAPGADGGSYRLSLLVRDLTTTTLTVDGRAAATVAAGSSVLLLVATAPAATGAEVLQVDRFDPLTGWHFNRLIRASAPSASIAWRPPASGRWRVRASYRGSSTASPSGTGYVLITVG